MAEAFSVHLVARGYEVDFNGHIAGAVLLQYGQHARWECLRAAGVDQAALAASGMQELRHADGSVVAEITNVGGLLDLETRRLVARPAEHWRSAAARPGLLGL
jgi:acyl-CoA thioester hydrolase